MELELGVKNMAEAVEGLCGGAEESRKESKV